MYAVLIFPTKSSLAIHSFNLNAGREPHRISLVFTEKLNPRLIPSNHTVDLCYERGGEPLVNMGLLKFFSFSSRFLRGIDPHSGSVYPHSGCLC